MKLKTKIGLGIASVVVASLPFFLIKEDKRTTLKYTPEITREKIDSIYKDIENRIIEDVLNNGEGADYSEPIWDVPVLRNVFRRVWVSNKSKTYIINDGVEIRVSVSKDMKYTKSTYVKYRINKESKLTVYCKYDSEGIDIPIERLEQIAEQLDE